MLMSISSRSRAQEEAAKIIQFMVNDQNRREGAGHRAWRAGLERGAEMIAPDLDELGKAQVDYVAAVTKVAVQAAAAAAERRGRDRDAAPTRRRYRSRSVEPGVKEGARSSTREAVNVLARA